MDWIAMLGRVLLVVLFLVAAVGKLTDRKGVRQALVEFGLPNRFAPFLSILLIAAEVAAAGLLLVNATVRWGAVGALGLLAVFSAAIGINLGLGRAPNCHCFGQLHSTPISARTLARNAALAVVAAVVLWQGGKIPDVLARPRLDFGSVALGAALLCLAVAVIEGWFLLNLVPQNGRILKRLDALEALAGITHGAGIPVGEPAPSFELQAVGDKTVNIGALWASGKPVLLFFTNPHCGPCDAVLPDIARWQRQHDDVITIAIISRDTLDVNRAKADEHDLRMVLVQKRREVAKAYMVESTPAAVLIDAEGKIASPIGYGPMRISELVREVVARADSRQAVRSPNGARRLADTDRLAAATSEASSI